MAFKSDKQRKYVMMMLKSGGKVDIEPKLKPKNTPLALKTRRVLSEREINLVRKRMNDGKISPEQVFPEGKTYVIGAEQERKGLDWLNNLRRTPMGKERKNNPFGQREEEVLDNFKRFEWVDVVDTSSPYSDFKFYIPVWRVIAKDGSSFDYHIAPTKERLIITG
jgi:hypothetical protein